MESRRTSKATTAPIDPDGSSSTTSTSSCTSSRARPRLFYGLERLWGSAERVDDPARRPGTAATGRCRWPSDSSSSRRRSSRRPARPASELLDHPTRGPGLRRRRWQSDPAAYAAALRIAAAIRCRRGASSARAAGALRRAAARHRPSSIARARSAPTTARFAPIVHALSYDGRRSLARPLAALMRQPRAPTVPGGRRLPASRFRFIRPGAARADSTRRSTSRGGSARRRCRPPALRRVRATPTQTGCRPRSATATCGTRSRSRAGARRSAAAIVVLDGRCQHDGRDARGVRRVLTETGAREVRAAYSGSSRDATALKTSAAIASLERSPSSTIQPCSAAWR